MEIKSLPGMEAALNPLEEAQLRSEEARRIFEASEDNEVWVKDFAEAWMADYWRLTAEGWPWRVAVYMIWASIPADKRQPKTQGELATRVLGLTSDRQIRKWREQNPAIDVEVNKLQKSALMKARAKVMQALIDAASNPSPRAATDRKTFLEMTGDYVPRQRVTVGPDLPSETEEVDEGELRALAAEPGGAWVEVPSGPEPEA